MKPRRKSAFNTRKHIIIVDEVARHWRCRYCGMDGYGKKFQLHYHLAGAFRHPKCPNVPREVFAKARHHVPTKRRLKTNKAEQQIPSRPHILGQFGEERQNNGASCGNQSELSIKNESSEVSLTICTCRSFFRFLLILWSRTYLFIVLRIGILVRYV